MNDFGVNIAGFTGVMRNRPKQKQYSVAERTVLIKEGYGCNPGPGLRYVSVRWEDDGKPDKISTHDLEYVIDTHGKRINKLPEQVVDLEPVKLTSEVVAAPKKVRRKA